ncbi:hypothetical protein ACFO0N_08335 [Halobium salinum]|uniref:Zinc ribbon domain-containing protein n=1 Tax=Halobium salinum TaxID=1364940 RepID=A0ABD5PAL5_9EURY|nr:hypothetical protein [Halobium salinum]
MHQTADEHRNAAVEALAGRDPERAGDEYTRTAWATLATPRADVGPFDADERGWVGVGLGALVVSAVCYRVAGRDARATHRGVEGVAVARDLRHALEHPVQRACLREFVADFRVVGGLDGVQEAYAAAAEAYEHAADSLDGDDPQRWATTPLFEAAAAPIKQVARGPANGEIAVAWEDLHGPDPSAPGAFLARRATYKRQRFPSLLARVVDDGVLAAPRGTTEYGTDHHRCPHCGSTDVNWVADSTLCLRCSRPTEPQ